MGTKKFKAEIEQQTIWMTHSRVEICTKLIWPCLPDTHAGTFGMYLATCWWWSPIHLKKSLALEIPGDTENDLFKWGWNFVSKESELSFRLMVEAAVSCSGFLPNNNSTSQTSSFQFGAGNSREDTKKRPRRTNCSKNNFHTFWEWREIPQSKLRDLYFPAPHIFSHPLC